MRQSIFSSALLVLLSIASKIGSSAAQLVDQERPERRGLKKHKKTKKSVKSTKSSKKCKVEKSPPKKGVKSPKACKGVDTTYEPKVIPPSGDLTNPDFLAAAGRCGAALQTSGFNFFDLDNYDKWFDDASILYLKETGYYQGPESISEYVRFVSDSELFEYYSTPIPPVSLPLVADGDTCVISSATVRTAAVKEEYASVEGDFDYIVGFRLSFTITSPDLSTVNISNIHLYYPPGFLQFIFEDAFDGEAVARRTCNVLETACSDTFYEKNCYNKVDECVNDVMTLPRTDGDNIDGKTMGCRTLHTEFASVNAKHCPHISFLPEYDANCFLKCQETANNVLADAFHPMELGFYKSVAVSAGIGEAQFVSPSIFPPAP